MERERSAGGAANRDGGDGDHSSSAHHNQSTAAAAPAEAPAPPVRIIPRPHRPLNAYNLFFQAERKRMVQAMEGTRGDSKAAAREKLGFGDMAKTVSKRWKCITSEAKAHFTRLAELDKQRYYREMNAWYRLNNDDTATETTTTTGNDHTTSNPTSESNGAPGHARHDRPSLPSLRQDSRLQLPQTSEPFAAAAGAQPSTGGGMPDEGTASVDFPFDGSESSTDPSWQQLIETLQTEHHETSTAMPQAEAPVPEQSPGGATGNSAVALGPQHQLPPQPQQHDLLVPAVATPQPDGQFTQQQLATFASANPSLSFLFPLLTSGGAQNPPPAAPPPPPPPPIPAAAAAAMPDTGGALNPFVVVPGSHLGWLPIAIQPLASQAERDNNIPQQLQLPHPQHEEAKHTDEMHHALQQQLCNATTEETRGTELLPAAAAAAATDANAASSQNLTDDPESVLHPTTAAASVHEVNERFFNLLAHRLGPEAVDFVIDAFNQAEAKQRENPP